MSMHSVADTKKLMGFYDRLLTLTKQQIYRIYNAPIQLGSLKPDGIKMFAAIVDAIVLRGSMKQGILRFPLINERITIDINKI